MCVEPTSVLSSFVFAFVACIAYFNFDKIRSFYKKQLDNFKYSKSQKTYNK